MTGKTGCHRLVHDESPHFVKTGQYKRIGQRVEYRVLINMPKAVKMNAR